MFSPPSRRPTREFVLRRTSSEFAMC